MAGVLAGCGGKAAAPAAGTAETAGKPRIALVMKSLANEFFQTMEDGARAHQAAHSDAYDLLAQGTQDETDVNRQVQIVEQMMAQRVDAIVIAPADSKAMIPVCKRAQEAGIVVINIDNRFDAGVLAEKGVQFPFVGPDNRKGAQRVAEVVASRLEPGDAVIVIEGAPNAYNAEQRRLGFEDAIRARGLRIVASQSAYWEMSRANQLVGALLAEHPDVKAFFCANDSMALGAVAALRAAGKAGEVLVCGFDNISAAKELMLQGELVATADQHADQLAVYGIEYALEVLRTRQRPADRETPVDLVTAQLPDAQG
jgi:ribose transport system substrate-binding protein